jgi:hypothetical protein
MKTKLDFTDIKGKNYRQTFDSDIEFYAYVLAYTESQEVYLISTFDQVFVSDQISLILNFHKMFMETFFGEHKTDEEAWFAVKIKEYNNYEDAYNEAKRVSESEAPVYYI